MCIRDRDSPDVGRNDPCPCGSGRKYKNCHGRPGMGAPTATAAGNGQSAASNQPTGKKQQHKKKARR